MIPKIVIVGRPNVGKSSILNLLARRRIAIVDPTAGVTRDRVAVTVEIPARNPGAQDHIAQVIDTGGYGIPDIETGDHGNTRDMTADVERQIDRGLHEADLVLFVTDAQDGVTTLDQQFATILHKQVGTTPTLPIVNKVDSSRFEPAGYEAASLGFGNPVLISVKTGHQKNTLYDAIRGALDFKKFTAPPPEVSPAQPADAPREFAPAQSASKDDTPASEKTARRAGETSGGGESESISVARGTTSGGGGNESISVARGTTSGGGESESISVARGKLPGGGGALVALVGKRNAGKSTLVNALAGDERVIVSEQPGTTRDAIDVQVQVDGQALTLIDTAGVRKTKSLSGDIEFYSQHRTLRSVRRADVCLLLIDAAVKISQVDRQLVQEIVTHHRPTVVVVNKWDLAEASYTQDQYVAYLDDALKGLSFAPIVFTSATKEEGLRDAIGMALNLYEQAHHRVSTGELNATVDRITAERGPSSKGGKYAKVYYATQVGIDPPTIALFVNHPEIFEGTYERYLINRFRDELPYSEVPLKLLFRGKQKMTAEQRIQSKPD